MRISLLHPSMGAAELPITGNAPRRAQVWGMGFQSPTPNLHPGLELGSQVLPLLCTAPALSGYRSFWLHYVMSGGHISCFLLLD